MTTSHRPRTYGFRLSLVDSIVLAVTIIASLLLWKFTNGLSCMGLLVVLHFFLFCNVFRVPRIPELIWGLAYLILSAALLYFEQFTPLWNAITILPVTLLVLLWSLRLPTYHGIFAKQWNPKLDDYLAGRI